MRNGERGQSLILVLVSVVAFALMLTAVLGFASSGLSASSATTAIARQLEAADAGAEFGIQKVKTGTAPTVASTSTESLPIAVNGESVSVVVQQLDASRISVSGPASLAVSASGDYQVLLADGTTALPYGATWSVTLSNGSAATGATLDQGGRFSATLMGCYRIRATLGNASATRDVAVGGASCP